MNEYVVGFSAYFVVGFAYSAIMAGKFEQDDEDAIFFNFVLWPITIFINIFVGTWRLISGMRPSYYKKSHYIWSWWD